MAAARIERVFTPRYILPSAGQMQGGLRVQSVVADSNLSVLLSALQTVMVEYKVVVGGWG